MVDLYQERNVRGMVGINEEYELLRNTVLEQGRVLGDDVLKVDSFLNHQLDVRVLNAIGKLFYQQFGALEIDKILTAEVSGIAIAAIAAQYFQVPVVFAKKTLSKNLDPDTWEGSVYSYTKQQTYQIRVAKRYLGKGEKILILDDFLANGQAIKGMHQILEESEAVLMGTGVVIEKSFQAGKEMLRDQGVEVHSLIKVTSLEGQQIQLREK
ncbi:xanthine phosphoribosyltransferase [Tindallia magadiensis]|uniref:Xanthine phosphoribosyltransferase n=1 Tax=Tindallia magadiensis TaxID=69895 RepID=A0A1I3E7I8_9FIRM|nr:xanthine phosphoribosyltransferase [Tindallia magadiensis]SFH94950.1 xanthine phosphoribosyltransferase [Tindallia magadiensis]